LSVAELLALQINEDTWAAVVEVCRWQSEHDAWAPPEVVQRACGRHRARRDVVYALACGKLRRAHIDASGAILPRAWQFVRPEEDAVILKRSDAPLFAAFALHQLLAAAKSRAGRRSTSARLQR
jgi:hypothetical protein